ncbi:serine/threonine protein kinase [Paucibacter sp. DJ2R-2]|uniref:serine/threonine protein kinase n=1 Tax=Paucibacter sp. DJ2R-2 TaxID=2893558 RepID=UPI0021E420DD|nr:serine/threonine protein kinase [Paucibacter sp. DJ2R-2]MCV2422450.1 protein kinase [Paucibacter sp. DJ4R-1]MCV2440398.1 protein kinase [Paucibacter sp. DJ2R-2]
MLPDLPAEDAADAGDSGAYTMPASLSDLHVPQLGRFHLLKRLGEGAQATVWLAHDPRLDREVALKVLHPPSDGRSVDEWLHEARAVSRLHHPNIVPVFEADIQDGQAYLVFEYVAGGSLADRLRRQVDSGGALPARVAVELSLGLLDGLQAAHQAGVVHRDLKPSNILIDAKGRPRVMDFGIAGRLSAPEKGAQAQAPQRIVGTPAYLSPEAARGEAPSPAMDVFAAAILLAEMLSGQRLNHDADPWASVRRLREQELHLPPGLGPEVDDALRAIVQRGLAREPAQRWPSAQAMHDALAHWLHPEAAPEAAAAQGEGAALEFLLRRMRIKSDFPAMSQAISRIQRLTQSEHESLTSLSNEILKDVALTQKLLRLVNTVQFRHTSGGAQGGGISTVSRAVALIGFGGIRNLALSLILLERMENKAHAQALREEFLRSLMAASLARELCVNSPESEEAFLAGMFYHLGRSLTEFYFPEEARQVRRMLRPEASEAGERPLPALSEASASIQVLGMSYEQLGLGVARQWGLPDGLQESMRRPGGEPPQRWVEKPSERQRWLAHAANAVADVILHTEPEQAHARVHAMAQRHARALGVSAADFDQAADRARARLSEMAEAMGIALPKGSPARRLLAPLQPAPDDSLSPHQLQATQVLEPTLSLSGQQLTREQAVEMMASGIQDITNAMVDSFKLNEVLRMILETIYRAIGFRRVVFCLRDPKSEQLTGRFGLGEGVEAVVPAFRVPLRLPSGGAVDLFTAVCHKGADTLIADASAANIAERLPTWYQGPVAAPSFLLLPMLLKGQPFAMIYADKARAGAIDLGEKELALLRTLRNQAVMAFKQVS